MFELLPNALDTQRAAIWLPLQGCDGLYKFLVLCECEYFCILTEQRSISLCDPLCYRLKIQLRFLRMEEVSERLLISSKSNLDLFAIAIVMWIGRIFICGI